MRELRVVRLAVAVALAVRSPSPGHADGFDDVLLLCPDDRVACVSSLDPAHFAEPWVLDGAPSAEALGSIVSEARSMGAVRRAPCSPGSVCGLIRVNSVLHCAQSCSEQGTSARGWGAACTWPPAPDRTVFWVPTDDAIVHFRSADDSGVPWDRSRNKMRMETLRRRLALEKVPVVRNRRALASERQADGEYKLLEERPWKQPAGVPKRLYGEDGELADGDGGLFKMLFPFERVAPRGSPLQSLLEDARGLSEVDRFAGGGR